MSDTTESRIFKAPVITFMGHVDAGKTSLQDAISNKTTTEDGGITQNVGTRYIDKKIITQLAGNIKGRFAVDERFPGIMMIDTPGHEAFNHMRATSSSQCDLAIVVIDIMDGVKPQTIESINILKENKIPFIIALTKIDRLDGWVNSNEKNLRKAIKKNSNVSNILLSSIEDIKWELSKIGVNAEFYFNNKKPASIYSIIPLSSITKEGIADLIAMISYLTFNWMAKKVTFTEKTKASVVKSYKDKRVGWVVEVILSNGYLNVGDEFMMCNHNNPVRCKIKNILVNVNGKFEMTTTATASSYCKIIGSNLEDIITGTYMYNINQMGESKALLKATESISDIWGIFNYTDGGVLISPSFGELSGSYYQLSKENIPVSKCIIGKLSTSIIDRINIMLTDMDRKHQVIYYFGDDDMIDKFNKYIKNNNYQLTIISNNIIYHLVDKAKEYIETSDDMTIEELVNSGLLNYPVKCSIVPGCVFNKGGTSEIVIGLEVIEGKLLKNTMIYVNNGSSMVNLGTVLSLEKNNEPVEEGKIGDKLAVKLSNPDAKSFGRHFEKEDIIISYLSRDIIDNLKKYFRKKLNKKEWLLVRDLKQDFAII